MKKLILLLQIFLVGCCYNSVKMRILDTDYKPTGRVLSYEKSGKHYSELRLALMEYGIKTLKYNVAEHVFLDEDTKQTQNTSHMHQDLTSGFTVEGSQLLVSISEKAYPDIVCLTGSGAQVYALFVEITDLETKEVIFTVRAKGMDEPCGYCRKTVYEEVAEKINDFFLKQAKK